MSADDQSLEHTIAEYKKLDLPTPTGTVSTTSEAEVRTFDPDWDLLVGHILVLLGYLMPWFGASAEHSRSIGGSDFLAYGDGTNWTALVPLLLIVGAIPSIWASSSKLAAAIASRTGLTASVLAVFVIASSFPAAERPSIGSVLSRPLGPGLIFVAVGVALIVTGTATSAARAHRASAING